jgi:cytidine deaminase
MIKKDLSFHIYEVDSLEELSQKEQQLVVLAREMTEKAYAPYSEFFVGAAVLLENGEILTGSNQENGAYPSGLCAERVAAFAASAMFPGVTMKTIAVSANSTRLKLDEPVSPCGACRQVLLEYEILQDAPIRVLLAKEDGKILIVEKVHDLLPLSFSGKALKKNAPR